MTVPIVMMFSAVLAAAAAAIAAALAAAMQANRQAQPQEVKVPVRSSPPAVRRRKTS